MDSVILISNGQIDFKQIIKKWEDKYVVGVNKLGRLALVIDDASIYMEHFFDGYSEYNDKQLEKLNMDNLHFCLVFYSNIKTLVFFLQKSGFDPKIYIDDDLDHIVPINVFCNANGDYNKYT